MKEKIFLDREDRFFWYCKINSGFIILILSMNKIFETFLNVSCPVFNLDARKKQFYQNYFNYQSNHLC